MPNKCPTLVLALATPPGAFLTRAVADNHKQVTVPMPPQRRAAAASEVQPAWAEDAALVQSTSRKVQITTTVPRDPVPAQALALTLILALDPDPEPGWPCQVYLHVPLHEKRVAIGLGAQFDTSRRRWFVTQDVALAHRDQARPPPCYRIVVHFLRQH